MLERGADVSIEANEGKSALDYARSKGHLEVVTLLEDEAREPKAKLVYDLVQADGHVHHAAVRNFFTRPRRFRTNPKVASAFLTSLDRLMTSSQADIAAETLLARYATVAQLWATPHVDDDDEGVAASPLASPTRSPSRSSSRASRDQSRDENEDVCTDDALELALFYAVFCKADGLACAVETAPQLRRLLVECGKRYSNAHAEPSEFVAVGDRNLMALARKLLVENPNHMNKLLPVIREFIQLQINNAPPELLVRVIEAFRFVLDIPPFFLAAATLSSLTSLRRFRCSYTHRPSYTLALAAITCEPQFQLFSTRLCEIIRAAREMAEDERVSAGNMVPISSPTVGPSEVRASDAVAQAAAADSAGPGPTTEGGLLSRRTGHFTLTLPDASPADGDRDHLVTLRGGPVQHTAVLSELHQEADGVESLFLTFGAAVAQRSSGTFDAPVRDPLRTLEASGLRPDSERQWQCESVCNVTRGTLKYGSVSKMTLGIELLLACDKSLAGISQLRTALGADAVDIEIVSIWNRFGEPTSGGWADVLVHFAFDADDNRHIVELRLVHQDLALVAEEHNAMAPYVKTRSALELLVAKGLSHRVPAPQPPQADATMSAARSASQSRSPLCRVDSGTHIPASPGAVSTTLALPAADDRVARLESSVLRLESTVAEQARLLSAQGELIKQLLASRASP